MKSSELQATPSAPRFGSDLASVCRASCRKLVRGMRTAKSAIVAEFRERLAQREHLVELAVNEAEALAWQSGFPHLIFPALALEKVNAVAMWHARQEAVRRGGAADSVAN